MKPFFRRAIRPLTAMLVFTGTAGLSAQEAATPQQVLDRYVAAVNASDIRAVGALISEQVERASYPGCKPEMSHKTCLITYVDETVVQAEGRITTLKSEVRDDTVHARMEVSSKTARGFGLERIVGTDVIRVQGGLIVAFRFVPEFSDEQTAVFFGKLGIGPRAVKR